MHISRSKFWQFALKIFFLTFADEMTDLDSAEKQATFEK